MLTELGYCQGIENYSRHLTGRAPGEPPPTLLDYFPHDFLLIVDESHVTVPQVGGMYNGDRARKTTLIDYGFRLPSCMDNRPLKFEEWDAMRPQSVFVSATPAAWELEQTGGVFTEQIIRPTGLIDPKIEIRPVDMQVDDLLDEVRRVAADGYRTLVTTLTKRMAEDLTEYYQELGVRVKYLHSDIDTVERMEIIRDLRLGEFDVLVGINLLREGLDMPEVSLIAILDADKEGFLRSERSLTQTAGRAARNLNGKVIFYADNMTGSMQRAIEETNRRREKQTTHNEAHGITPATIVKQVAGTTDPKNVIHILSNHAFEGIPGEIGEGAGFRNSFGWFWIGEDITDPDNLHTVFGCRTYSICECPCDTIRTRTIDFATLLNSEHGRNIEHPFIEHDHPPDAFRTAAVGRWNLSQALAG